jgi:hypothetical protein
VTFFVLDAQYRVDHGGAERRSDARYVFVFPLLCSFGFPNEDRLKRRFPCTAKVLAGAITALGGTPFMGCGFDFSAGLKDVR